MNVAITLSALQDNYMESTIVLTQLPGIQLDVLVQCSTIKTKDSAYVKEEIPLGTVCIYII